MKKNHLNLLTTAITAVFLVHCNPQKSGSSHSSTKGSQFVTSRKSTPVKKEGDKDEDDGSSLSVIKVRNQDDTLGKSANVSTGELSLYDFCGGENKNATDPDIKHTVEVLTEYVKKNIKMKDCKSEVIDKLKNLEELSLSNKEIVNLIPLSQMTKIKKLNLAKNKISNLDGLENMSQIDFLNLTDNELENVSILGSLKTLTILWLNKNRIKILDAFSHSTNLKELHAEENRLVSLLEVAAIQESGTKVFTSNNGDARTEDEALTRDKNGFCGASDDKCELIMGVGEKINGL